MKITHFILLPLLVMGWFVATAHKEKSYLFKGTLNKDSVLFELIGHEEGWNARCFWYSDLHEKNYFGAFESGFFTFSDNDEVITIQKKKWKVNWVVDGKKLKSKLSLLDTLTSEKEAYFNTRISKLVFQEKEHNDSIVQVVEKHSGVAFFRIPNPLNDTINHELQRLHISYALHQLGEPTTTISYLMTHLSPQWLSFRVQNNEELEYFNYSLNTCLPIRIEDVVWFGDGEKPFYQSQEWFSYRYNTFPDKIKPYLKVQDTCLDTNELWQFPSWYLEGEYLVLLPFSSFGVENCNLSSKKIALTEIQSKIK